MLEQIDIEKIKSIALEAGEAVMEIYQRDFAVEYKDDKSPLTEADRVANEIICTALEELNSKLKIKNSAFQHIPMMSEENKETPYEVRKNWEYYWCIDPIDGTKEFIKKNDEFTVNIALIHKDTPVLGVVYAPALGELYHAKQGEGAYLSVVDSQWSIIDSKRLPCYKKDENVLNVVASKSHLSQETEEFIKNLSTSDKKLSTISKGSSLKLCMVAIGEADIYPRLAPTMEW
ncbi:MAG: 3'(2'),5'-bisphosphate nucleotidase CysQ, partial [Sulfurimonadaceae bacterium]